MLLFYIPCSGKPGRRGSSGWQAKSRAENTGGEWTFLDGSVSRNSSSDNEGRPRRTSVGCLQRI